jgi:5-hydroxyisourate hydrolase
MSSLSTHILDISTGKPAPGVTVFLARDERVLAQGITDGNGRIGAFSVPLTPGRYRLVAQGSGLRSMMWRHCFPARKLIL